LLAAARQLLAEAADPLSEGNANREEADPASLAEGEEQQLPLF